MVYHRFFMCLVAVVVQACHAGQGSSGRKEPKRDEVRELANSLEKILAGQQRIDKRLHEQFQRIIDRDDPLRDLLDEKK